MAPIIGPDCWRDVWRVLDGVFRYGEDFLVGRDPDDCPWRDRWKWSTDRAAAGGDCVNLCVELFVQFDYVAGFEVYSWDASEGHG